jgi:integrase
MGHPDITAHGFRSTFREWAGETTNHPSDVCEAALAHALAGGDKVRAAYQRGDLFEKRRALMDDWAEYVRRGSADNASKAGAAVVVPLRRAANTVF